MTAVGIITEYNPFHNGHKYLIEEAKRQTGADYCIVVMSGNFVQRGEPAVCDKYLRTQMALCCGADAVFEIPAAYATGSAEIFAEAGVKLLYTIGCIDYIAFGSECGDVNALMKAAEILLSEPDSYKEFLSANLKAGQSYASARAEAFLSYAAAENIVLPPDIFTGSNNILAIEYCKAILKLRNYSSESDRLKLPVPVTVQRIGTAFNSVQNELQEFASASSIRAAMIAHPDLSDIIVNLQKAIPNEAFNIINEAIGTTFPIVPDDFSDMLYIRLATIPEDDLEQIADIPRDLLNAIKKYKNEVLSFKEFISLVKTKNYAYSTVSRSLLRIILNIKDARIRELKGSCTLPYARLLGFRKASSKVLRSISDNESCTLITKLADADRTEPLLADDILAAECYRQVIYTKFGTKTPSEFERSVIRI